MDLQVWVIAQRRVVQIDDHPGTVPAIITGYVSEDAAKAAEARGYATVSEIGFPSDAFVGMFNDWDNAWKAANEKAKELGYEVEDATTLWMDDEDFEDEDDNDDFDDTYWWDYDESDGDDES